MRLKHPLSDEIVKFWIKHFEKMNEEGFFCVCVFMVTLQQLYMLQKMSFLFSPLYWINMILTLPV